MMKLEPFALERWMTRHETNVKYDIAESGICPLTVNDLLAFEAPSEREETLDALLNLPLGYNEAIGTRGLRERIASTYAGCEPDNILVTTGAIEANFLLFNVLLDAGDDVIAPFPAYQQLYSVPRAIGCKVSLWEVNPANDFTYDLAALKKMITPKTKLIVVNSPHNPTGAMLTAAEMAEVYALADAAGAWVLSDEAYRWLTIPGGEPLPEPIFNRGPRGISVGTLSKPFGLPGLRLGWIAGPKELIAKCWAMRDYVSLSPGKFNDAVGLLAFKHREQIIARNNGIITANLAAAEQWIAERSDFLSWKAPRAGLLALLHYKLNISSLELSDKLALEYSVMLAPGSAFGYENYLRIGIGQNPAIFKTGLEEASRCFAGLRQ